MLISLNQTRRKIIAMGQDLRGLGRWMWTKYQGKCSTTLRVISAYQCCNTLGSTTVQSQQWRYFDSLGINLHLREVFINDLIEALKE